MGYEIEPRIERKSSAGLVLTHDELVDAVRLDVLQKSKTVDRYAIEASNALHNIAVTAEFIGKNACSRTGECELECSGVSLVEQSSIYDGKLNASCKLEDCKDTGVKAAFLEFTRHQY